MSEHIKTGEEINSDYTWANASQEYTIKRKEWVSLSWLKDIEKHNPLLTIEDVLSLLEEKQ